MNAPLSLPVIDLTPSWGDSPQAEAGAAQVARQIDAACQAHGFFYVTGHGVPAELIERLFQVSAQWFALPEAVKLRWHIEHSGGLQRGHDPIGWQSLDPGKPADLKESFYLGRDLGPEHPRVQAGVPRHGANLWPDEALVPGFKATANAYADALAHLGRHLMGLIALALGLPRAHFEPVLQEPMPVLRLLHYPPQQASQVDGQIGSGAHTDWGAITLLAQDNSGGLQVRSSQGQWFEAPPLPGSFVVNLGDMMQRWTHDRYRSNLHRVINRHTGRDRQSIAYFYEVDCFAEIAPLPGCVPEGTALRYPTITAGEHIAEMYRRTTVTAAQTDAVATAT